MKKRRRIAFVGLVAILLAVATWFALRPREPEYQGKMLSTWLKQTGAWVAVSSEESSFLTQPEFEARKQEVATALRNMGTNALPHLVRRLSQDQEPSALRKAIVWLNESQKVVKVRLPGVPPWEMYASEAFRLLGTNAEPAIPELAKLLQQERTSLIAADCLFSIGPASLPTFIQALTNSSDRVQNLSLQILGDFGPAAREAIPVIAEIAHGTNSAVYNAIQVLSEVDTNCIRHLAVFESHLYNTNFPTAAAFALGRMGPEGVRILLCALTNENKQVRIAALAALQPEVNEFGPGRANTPADYSFRRIVCLFNLQCLTAALKIYQHQEDRLAIPALARSVVHTNDLLQAMAVEQLSKHGQAGALGLSLAAESGDGAARHAAIAALKKVGLELQGGAITRGRTMEKRLAVVFTGHSYAEGGETIMNELAKRDAKGSFFLTGDFLTNTVFAPLIERIVREGHYLGPHSDKHLLYCSWEAKRRTLVSCRVFKVDLAANLQKIHQAQVLNSPSRMKGANATMLEAYPFAQSQPEVCYFLPPYEHYNRDIVQWTLEMELTLINFTPGTRSNADYTGEADTNFVSSQAIFDSIVQKEREDPNGLNGFILLLHLGSGPGRKDKFHHRFGELLDYLAGKGYEFVRVDELLEPKTEETK